MRSPALLAIGSSLAMLVAACSSTDSVNQCAPMTGITATGTLQVSRGANGAGATTYVLSKAQIEDLFQAGELTVTAAQGGVAGLTPTDPIVLVKMPPSSNDPGTYELGQLGAQIAYCSTTEATLVVVNGALMGCAPAGMPMTTKLEGTLTVTSASTKSISSATGSTINLSAQYGSESGKCN
jgi:hypothetical protein